MLTNLLVAELRLGLVEFNITYVANIINAVIMFLIMKHFLFKPMQAFMKAREDEIKKQYSDAQEAQDKAVAMKSEYESKIKQAQEEGEAIIKDYTKKAQIKASEIVDEANADATKIKADAEKQLASEVKKTVHTLKNELSELSILAASKVVGKELDKKGHESMIDELIAEVGDVKWQN